MGMNNMRTLNNHSIALLVTVLAALFTLFTALSYGAAETSLTDVFKSIFSSTEGSFNTRIIVELRMPRTLLAFLAGSGLAIAGLILQTVTRNPLADPYLFGISSGASLGVVILMAFVGISAGFALSAAALAGSLVAMSLLILIAGRQQSGQVESMLLAVERSSGSCGYFILDARQFCTSAVGNAVVTFCGYCIVYIYNA